MALEQLFSDIDDFCRVFEVVCRKKMMVNLVAGLIAYTHPAKKPSLKITRTDLEQLPPAIAF